VWLRGAGSRAPCKVAFTQGCCAVHGCMRRFRISRFKYDPVPGVDGALVTFKLLPPAHRLQVCLTSGNIILGNTIPLPLISPTILC